jgi:putative drug exporter of the RND superfamily
VYVTGDAASDMDFVSVIGDYTPVVFGYVLGLSFLLLLVTFRSVVVPLKAVAMNLLSVGAAYGLLVLVFQRGIGAEMLGFQQTEVIEPWLPLFLFTILFGLSMDYHVFLLSRIKERYDETGDNHDAVAFGLRSTGSLITGAALIMVAVFGGFAMGELLMFQQMGFGLAVAIILDATVIRSVLVPASMELLGDRNWYFPSWLEFLPEIHIEGRAPAMPVLKGVASAQGGVATAAVMSSEQ